MDYLLPRRIIEDALRKTDEELYAKHLRGEFDEGACIIDSVEVE